MTGFLLVNDCLEYCGHKSCIPLSTEVAIKLYRGK